MPRSRNPKLDRQPGDPLSEEEFMNEAAKAEPESLAQVQGMPGEGQTLLALRLSDTTDPRIRALMAEGKLELVGEQGAAGREGEMHEGRGGLPTLQEQMSDAVVAVVPGADEIRHLAEMSGLKRVIREKATRALEEHVDFPVRVLKGEEKQEVVTKDGDVVKIGATIPEKLSALKALTDLAGAGKGGSAGGPAVSASEEIQRDKDGNVTGRKQTIKIGDREVQF